MDITNKIIAELQQENQSEPEYLSDIIAEFQDDVRYLDAADMTDVESQLNRSQYAYVRFGLILEKVRNQCMWKRCAQKFADFRHFCQRVVNLNTWQVANAIKSAKVAVTLAFLGHEELPRNASQALKLAELPVERLGQVWGNVVASCEGHKITALAIESQIHPDKQVTNSTLRLPAAVVDGLTRQAIERGLTLQEYLQRLAEGTALDDDLPVEITESAIEINDEMSALVDRVEYQWLKPAAPKQIIETTLDRFDEFMTGLVGQFIPPPMRKSHA
jgi:hypothetical protein